MFDDIRYWEDYAKHCIMLQCECGYRKPIPEDIYMQGIRELECPKCKRILKSVDRQQNLYCEKTDCKYCSPSDYAYYGKCTRQNIFMKHDEDGNFYCDGYREDNK